MATKKTIHFEVKSTVGKVAKDTKKLEENSRKAKRQIKHLDNNARAAAGSFTLMGISAMGVRTAFSRIIPMARLMFSSIKAGLITTGIGALVVAMGSLVQYFRDSEEGMSAWNTITSGMGVVTGNVTDLISDLGKALYHLANGDFGAMKDALDELKTGVMNFHSDNAKEVALAIVLEGQKQALRVEEREHLVETAVRNKDIQRLRLEAREEEKFSLKERADGLREALRLSDEQMNIDVAIVKRKRDIQKFENGLNKSSTENLQALAVLEAEVFNIEASNYAKRKLMTAELTTMDKQLLTAAQNKIKALETLRSQEDIYDKEVKEQKRKDEEAFSKELQEIYAQTDKSMLELNFEALRTAENRRHDAQVLEISQLKLHEDKKTLLLDAANKVNFDNNQAIQDREVLAKKENNQLLRDASVELFHALASLAFENKALATAGVIIDTAMGAHKAIAKAGGNPIGWVQAAAITASGIAAIKDINSTDIPLEIQSTLKSIFSKIMSSSGDEEKTYERLTEFALEKILDHIDSKDGNYTESKEDMLKYDSEFEDEDDEYEDDYFDEEEEEDDY